MAEERVERLLLRVTAALDGAAVPYAVIGGNAVATWVATVDDGLVRNTKDVDLLLRREDLPAAAAAVASADLVADVAAGVPVFLPAADSRLSRGVHVVVANEPAGRSDPRPAPDVARRVWSRRSFWVVSLDALLFMKLQANRLHDRVHVQDLFQAGLITGELARTLPDDLRERLREVRDTLDWPDARPEF